MREHARKVGSQESGGEEHDAAKGSSAELGAAGDAAARRIARHGAAEHLGSFDVEHPPGHALGGKTQHLAPGQSLSFEVAGNQIYNVVDLATTGPITVEKTLVKAMNKGQLGDSNTYRYTITMSAEAKAGAHATVTSEPTYQSRSDPGWAFSFKIACA